MSRRGRRGTGRAPTARSPDVRPSDRAGWRPSRLRVLVGLVALLGLAQILYEDVVLFIATTRGGVSGLLATPLVAVGVPLLIAGLMILLLVGGALLADDDAGRARAEQAPRQGPRGGADRGDTGLPDGPRDPDTGDPDATDPDGGERTD